jgi:hypothetical protein
MVSTYITAETIFLDAGLDLVSNGQLAALTNLISVAHTLQKQAMS